MARLNLVVITVFALLSAACSAKASGPPEIAVDRTVCSHCGMLVSEPAYAAAFQATGGEPRIFDDIGCMLDALRRETTSPPSVWLQDADGGGWLMAHETVFVVSPQVRTPMAGGMLAYASLAAAERAATAHGGEVVRSFHELMTRGDAK
jgi:copper chaperone NosL